LVHFLLLYFVLDDLHFVDLVSIGLVLC